eukprot:3241838-Pleurochrysis_carterae.AAC.1
MALDAFESEFKVGVGRVVSVENTAAADGSIDDADVTVDWCFVVGQNTEPTHPGYAWPANP